MNLLNSNSVLLSSVLMIIVLSDSSDWSCNFICTLPLWPHVHILLSGTRHSETYPYLATNLLCQLGNCFYTCSKLGEFSFVNLDLVLVSTNKLFFCLFRFYFRYQMLAHKREDERQILRLCLPINIVLLCFL